MTMQPFAEVKIHQGTPTVFIDGQPSPYHLAWLQTPDRQNLDSFKRVVAATARRTGVHLYAFENGTVSMGRGPAWIPGPREGHADDYDLDAIAGDFLPILDADPEARFHVRLYMEFSPEWATDHWWPRRHPEECVINNVGWQKEQSFASLVWRAQVKDFIRRFVAHVERLGLLDRIVAYQVNAGSTCEWFKYCLQVGDLCGDYSPPMQRYFREFLRQRYGRDEAALRQAWADPNVTFETAEVPSHALQFAAGHYLLRDPATEQRAIDYLRATSALHAELIEEFCAEVKAATQRRALAGVFCGYWIGFQLNSDYFRDGTDLPGAHTRLQRTGHLGFHRMLQCPDLDFFVSPLDYGFRGIGGHAAAMIPNGAVHAHGKIYIQENDERCWHPTLRDYGAVRSGAEYRAVYRRTLADAITSGMGTWSTAMPWLVHKAEHLSGDPGGMMHSDTVKELPAAECSRCVDEYAACHRVDCFALGVDRTPVAEICVLLDDESFYHQTYLKNLELPSVYQMGLRTLPHLGAPAEFHVLNDFLAGRLRPFKLYVFVNALQLDDARRAQLKRQLGRKGPHRRVALWLYAGGVLNRDLSVDHMADATGFRCAMTLTPWGPFMNITDFTHPITRGLPEDLTWGTDLNVSPTFTVRDPGARALGNVIHAQGRCAEGFAVKEFARWRSVFCATPNIPPAVLRGVARYAGVHLYSEAGDVLYAGRELLAVHTVSGGARTFRLPRKAGVVVDLFTRKVVARNTRSFTVKLPTVSTTMWYTGPAGKVKGLLAKPG
ncbi:MAG: hypothetical protein K8T26_04950 [Lentisphaerae bacterium]|nr:hypothetical protein [Lentisphaerota bacterium]